MDEHTITSAVCAFLESGGWRVDQRERTREYHVDVVATDLVSGRRRFVEVAGGTSSKRDSARHGQGFTPSQIAAHVARVLLTTLKVRSTYPDQSADEVLVAVPDDRYHRAHLAAAAPALRMAGIGAQFVAADGTVSGG